MPKTDAAAIFAMLFGGYDGIRPELLESFTATGIVHILSVSGSHITLLAATAGLLGRMLCLPQRLTIIMAVVTIVAYGILAGGVPPVIRSAIMGILTLLATSFQRASPQAPVSVSFTYPMTTAVSSRAKYRWKWGFSSH